MITKFARAVDILKQTGENQVQCVLFSSGEMYHLF